MRFTNIRHGASVRGFKSYTEIDSVQNRAIRYFLGVHRFTPNLAINGDIGWLSFSMKHWYHMIRMWNRVILMGDIRLTKRIFSLDYASGNNNNRSSEVKRTFTQLDMLHVDSYETVMKRNAQLILTLLDIN